MRRESRKKPVLTSPWKIGMLVALLLVAISVGAVYYVVRVYSVDLHWLNSQTGQWRIDSYLFFREMYILAAAVLTLALFSYFLVSSAVRRYKFYLNSGQDYRKMISLAESVDDLTNPAQIAKLSDYPELQTVLRNYGDRIREVSQELEEREHEQRSVDLEMEIESLLRGDAVEDTVVEGKWWAPLFRKLAKYTMENRQVITGIEGRIARIRQIFCSVALTSGKVLESVGGASVDIVNVMRAVGELNSVAGELNVNGNDGSTANGGSSQEGPESAIAVIENSLRRLEQGGRELSAFSDDSNNLALSIALTAAKGSAGDRDLAQYAEQARETAERFKKFSAAIAEVTGDIAGGCRVVREKFSIIGTDEPGGRIDLHDSVAEISSRIEQRSRSLQQRITSLEHEFEEVNTLLQNGLSELDMESTPAEGSEESHSDDAADERSDGAFVNFGSESDDGSDFVVDHGRLWEEQSFAESEGLQGDALKKHAEAGGDEQLVITRSVYGEGEAAAGEPSPPEPAVEDLEQTVIFAKDIADAAAAEKDAEARVDDSLMKMPGQNWLKVDVEKDEQEPVVDVEVREDLDEAGMQTGEADVKAIPPEDVREQEAVVEQQCEDNDEPIYDLFELGAVEYVEETQRH